MKKLKFHSSLVPLVLSGEKTTTWRLFDEKDLQEDDIVEFFEVGGEVPFARALLTHVYTKLLGELDEKDWEGHEKFASEEEMYATYERYYNQPVTPQTTVKIITFKLQD